jgi:hypothetical protein
MVPEAEAALEIDALSLILKDPLYIYSVTARTELQLQRYNGV